MRNDDKYGWPTTRRYPRTMNEAFPNDVENAKWWYPPERRNTIDKVVMFIGIAIWLGVGYYFWKTT